MFKDWIIKYSTIAKSIISLVINIKNEYEKEQQRYEIEKYKQQIKQIEEEKQKEKEEYEKIIRKRTIRACELFKRSKRIKGSIYVASSKDKIKKYEYKIGLIYKSTIEGREGGLHTADPELNILCSRDVTDVFLTEIIVHNFLS